MTHLYRMYDKIIISVLIFAETILFCYTPRIAQKFSKYRNDWINVDNMNNATSGALLALSITHLLPEGFQSDPKNFTMFGSVDMRGFIVVAPILLLVTIDFLAGHHCGNQAKEEPNMTLSNESLCIEEHHINHMDCEDKLSHASSTSDSETMNTRRKMGLDIILINLRRVFSSRSLYLLMAFYGHSVLEGSLIGSDNGTSVWAMGFGILAHKWAECLLLTSTITNIIKSEFLKNLCLILFSFCVPIGTLIGYHTVASSDGICYTVFSLLAVGFFIYLSFELFTANTGQKTSSRVILWTFFILGSTLMSIILAISNVLENERSRSIYRGRS